MIDFLRTAFLVLLMASACLAAGITMESQRFSSLDGVPQQRFASSVAISGNTAVFGAPAGSIGPIPMAGSVYVYVYDDGAWTLQSHFSGNDTLVDDRFGASVALEGDTMVVGATGVGLAAQNEGAVYVFSRTNGIWTQQAKLMNPVCTTSLLSCQFGYSVGISNGTVAIGSPGQARGNMLSYGAVYVYTRVNEQWTQQQEIFAADGFGNQGVGNVVDIDQDTIIFGASNDRINGNNSQGSVYVWTRQSGVWSQQTKLTDPEGVANLRFGQTVDLDTDKLIVGSGRRLNPQPQIPSSGQIFVRTNGVWTREAKLTPSAWAIADGVTSVAIDDGLALISSNGPQTATLFEKVGASWVEKNDLVASDGQSSANFGSKVKIEGNRLIVTSPDKTIGFNSAQGAAYFYVRSTAAPDLLPEFDSGVSNTDNITNNRSLTFTVGDLTPGAVVQVLRGNEVFAAGPVTTTSVTVIDPTATENATTKYSVRQTINGEMTSPAVLFVTVDTIGPVPSISQAPGQQDPTQYMPVSFRATFNETIYGTLTSAAISLAGSSADVSAAVVTTSVTSGIATIQVNNLLTEGAVVMSILPNVLQDAAGNQSVPSVAVDNSITIDVTGPFVTINQAASQADPGSTPVNFTVVFSEPIAENLASGHLSYAGSTVNTNFLSANITGSGTTYNVAMSVSAQTAGTIVVSVRPGLIRDIAGNLNFASSSTDNSVTVDTVRPTVTVEQAPGQADPATTQPINFRVQFSKPVTGFVNAGLSFTGSTANISNARVLITGSGTTYNIAVSGVGPDGGVVRVSTLASAGRDAFGNPSSASTSTDNSITFVGGIMDRSFELTNSAGTNPYWGTTSTWFGTSLCITNVCGNANGTATPRTGSAWVWFDGTGQTAAEQGTASQFVTFPAGGVATLSYYLKIGFVTAPFNSVLQVKIDGTTVQIFNEPSTAETAYTQRTIDASAFADGGVHQITFQYNRPAGGTSDNFSIDDVSLILPAPVATNRAAFDFDGDGMTDLSIFRPVWGDWWYSKSSNGGNGAFKFGVGTDKIVPADFTGDGKTDIAVWRPSTGEWLVLRSEDSSFYSFPFGSPGDIPAPADFDADGKADAAIFRPSNSTWYITNSGGGTTISQFGSAGDMPVAADYDGDGKADIAIYRPALGQWWLNRSTSGLIAYQFGSASDKTVCGDYTGDGKADVAFWRPAAGEWYILRSDDLSYYAFPFGISTDVPSPGDYDGDGKMDAAVFRPSNSTWYAQRTTAGTLIQQFGLAGDLPVPNAYVR